MDKILGLDLGTNSIGWAIAEERAEGYTLREHGVNSFSGGGKDRERHRIFKSGRADGAS